MSCLPAFLIGMAGSSLSIHGAIFLGKPVSHRLASRDLTPLDAIPTLKIGGNYRYAQRTAHMLLTLRSCLNDLDNEYMNMKPRSESDELSPDLYAFPHFKAFKSKKNEYFSLIYRSHLVGDRLSTRLVFLADAVPRLDSQSSIRCVVQSMAPRHTN